MTIALFVFGAIWGSFLDVIAMRYHPDKSLFHRDILGGRSRCSACGTTLRWFELIPIISFVLQWGHCRSCKARIHPEHLIVEMVSGLVFVAVPRFVVSGSIYLHGATWVVVALSAIWIATFFLLALMTMIDLRWQIIPDEINVMLIALGVFLAVVESHAAIAPDNSFLGPYGLLFGVRFNPWINALLGMVAGMVVFGILILATRGRGMGMGDLKLAAALGTLFRFPDIIILSAFAFVIGSIFGIGAIISRNKTLKSVIPFGPFIALAAATIFFFGEPIAQAYFSLARAYFSLFS